MPAVDGAAVRHRGLFRGGRIARLHRADPGGGRTDGTDLLHPRRPVLRRLDLSDAVVASYPDPAGRFDLRQCREPSDLHRGAADRAGAPSAGGRRRARPRRNVGQGGGGRRRHSGDGLQAAAGTNGGAASDFAAANAIAPDTAGDQTARSLAEALGHATDALGGTANPLPQALILTAIVISFSIFAFLLVLTFRAYQSMETDNVDDMRIAEGDAVRPPLGY